MRRALFIVIGLLTAGLVVQSAVAGADRHHVRKAKDVLEFETMAGVVEPFTGAAHPIRGVEGGGLPWEIDRARGELRANGRLDVTVRGLVLARRDPVPAALQGTNPIPQFGAIVNCLTPEAPDAGVNLMTDLVPATSSGDARIRTKVALPKPCIAPIIFVTSPTGAWFAATGR
jgi:hypothetical protein